MDLIDIKNIYQGKINNYFLTKLKAIDYYELQDVQDTIYTPKDVLDMICFNFVDNQNIISCPLLFIYCTCLTNDWTKEIDFENILNDFKQSSEEDIISTINSYSVESFVGLKKYLENQDYQGENNLCDQFLSFFKDNCFTNIEKENKDITMVGKDGYSQQERERANQIKNMKINRVVNQLNSHQGQVNINV